MDLSNRPQTISAQEFGLRHMQALQSLRDETLLVFNALEKAPQAELDQSFRALPRLVKDAPPDFAATRSRAKLSLAINALRRVVPMNSSFLERIFPVSRESVVEAGQKEGRPRSGALQVFREKLRQVGASEIPAATLASLATLERLLHEELAGPNPAHPRPPVVELILVEMDANNSSDESAPLKARPWQPKLENADVPEVNARLLESIFSTSIVVAHEALQAGEKLFSKKNT